MRPNTYFSQPIEREPVQENVREEFANAEQREYHPVPIK